MRFGPTVVVAALIVAGPAAHRNEAAMRVLPRHVRVRLMPVGGSGVKGFVELAEADVATKVGLQAIGADPGEPLMAMFYETTDCTPSEDMGEIGDITAASILGVTVITGRVEANFGRIGSVAVLDARDLSLLACARVPEKPLGPPGSRTHPGFKEGRPFQPPTEPE